MRHLHLEKKGLRGLAIAESFTQTSKKSILAGVVMRRDFVIDGFAIGKTTIAGDDANEQILNMYQKLDRPDISYLLISGIIISMYNMINIQQIQKQLQIPIIAITYQDSKGITEAIKNHFPHSYETKLEKYEKLGNRQKIQLHTGFDIFVRTEGCSVVDAKHILNDLTLQGSIPEPLRVVQILAKTLLSND